MNLTTKAWFNAIIAKDGFSRPIWMGTTAANAPMNCSAMTDALISRLEQAEAESREEENRISRLYADNKAAFEVAQSIAATGEFQVFEKDAAMTLIDRLEASEQENAKLRGSLVTLGVSYELDRNDSKPTYYQWQGKLYTVDPAALKASNHQEEK